MSPARPRRLVPDPPRPIDPLVEVWPAGQVLYRVHGQRFAASAANPGPYPHSRFAFFRDPPIPVLYAGATEEVAVAETLLHDLPDAGGRLVPAVYESRLLSVIVSVRRLRLAQFHSGGLRRLGVRPGRLTDTSVAHYSRTIAWAEAVYADTDLDGIVWMSRRWNGGKAVVLFGDRVPEADLTARGDYGRAFITPPDLEWLATLCHRLKIALIPPW